MIIKTADFKDICSTILTAIDSNEISTLTETLELKVEDKVLYMNVTNGEYYASVKFEANIEEDFNAAVNASLFLKLIAAVTTENIELNVIDNYVEVKANGVYKIPMIYDNDKLLSIPKITINNVTVEMNVSGDIFESILNYNSKELLRGITSKPVQKMYYVDEQGCITFTTGACVNKFTLEKPIKVLFNSRLVKLFKLFKNDNVEFKLGYDTVNENLIQTKVSFTTDKIIITAITNSNDELLNQVPVNAIRNRANTAYANNVVFDKNELLDTINRLLLFSAGYGTAKNLKPYSLFEYNNDKVTIYDSNKENKETLQFKNDTKVEETYSMTLDLYDLKSVLDTISDEFITLSFGNHQAIALKTLTLTNIVPECKVA